MSYYTEECRVSHRDDSSDSQSTASTSSSSQQLPYETDIPEHSKRRVDLATAGEGLSGKRCLIENIDEVNIVHYTHCLDRDTEDHVLDALEFSWGMSRGTLNVNTRHNVFRLGSKFHALYSKKPPMCILLPEEHIIQQYYDAKNDRNNKFPDINEPSYKYNFLAHDDMVSVPIHRLTSHDDLATAPPTADYAYFAHPYTAFGPVVSHVHPRFVICDAGKKMEESGSSLLAFSRLYPNHVRAIEMAAGIWKAWTNVANIPDFMAFCKQPIAGDNVSSTSKRTSTRRLFQSVKKRHNQSPSRASTRSSTSNRTPARRLFQSVKKRRGDHNESPSRPSKRAKMGRGKNDGIWLDGETLREHDSKFSRKTTWKHKKASISHWTKAVSTTDEAVEQTMDLDIVTDGAQ